ncbi:unnamed protein product [Peronospora belbahrii]|uniref:Tify domain-containing protein n=1 Tax=Peronospora belbahrii TaxID=622444 RepID=A0AAU9LCM4_9STRA|nr:unnamed protein product [Peronospora belbahrii]CAH0514374.1 unnamed protein product [Peronospora belbahrii]
MTPVNNNSSLSESSAVMDMTVLTQSTNESALQHSQVNADQVLHSENDRRRQETVIKPQDVTKDKTVSRVMSGSSLMSDGGISHSHQMVPLLTDCVTIHNEKLESQCSTSSRNPRHVTPVISIQTTDKMASFNRAAKCSTAFDSNLTRPRSMKKKSLQQVTPNNQRPSRAAAAAATAGMTRQVKQERIGSLEMLISSALELENMDIDMEMQESTKKNKMTTKDGLNRALKRSRVTTMKMQENTLEIGSSTRQKLLRGKKQRQSTTYRANLDRLSSIGTDMSPLSFTSTSSELRVRRRSKSKSKQNVKTKTKGTHLVREMSTSDNRHCEFCKSVANICVLMHCQACHRVYHAKCLLHAFKPYVDESTPIFDQIERLQLQVPERRGNMFRCSSCKAAFLDFYESEGYMWDCDCPTCSQPEKTVLYRRMKLVQMMNDMGLEKQRKKEQKVQRKNGTFNTGGKPPASTPSRSNLLPHGRRIRGSSTISDDHVASLPKLQITTSETRRASVDDHEIMKVEPVSEPEELELSGDDLVGAVQIVRDEKNDNWCFPVMCSQTSSVRESGVMKTGKCKWFPEKHSLIECNCCAKAFNLSEFVHHTDSSLVKNANAANKQSMPFLFVQHRDATQYTLLKHFIRALRDWSDRHCAKNTVTKPRRNHTTKQEILASVKTPTTSTTHPDAVTELLQRRVSRLQALALFKRPKHENSISNSTAVGSIDPASLDFVAQVVCLSPSYVINMQNGSLADRVVRSKTTAPEGSFPRKAGWMTIMRTLPLTRRITCCCCKQIFSLDEFVEHAGISLRELQKRSHQLLYIVERQDESALLPFKTFLSDLDFITSHQVDMFLDELLPPLARPIWNQVLESLGRVRMI